MSVRDDEGRPQEVELLTPILPYVEADFHDHLETASDNESDLFSLNSIDGVANLPNHVKSSLHCGIAGPKTLVDEAEESKVTSPSQLLTPPQVEFTGTQRSLEVSQELMEKYPPTARDEDLTTNGPEWTRETEQSEGSEHPNQHYPPDPENDLLKGTGTMEDSQFLREDGGWSEIGDGTVDSDELSDAEDVAASEASYTDGIPSSENGTRVPPAHECDTDSSNILFEIPVPVPEPLFRVDQIQRPYVRHKSRGRGTAEFGGSSRQESSGEQSESVTSAGSFSSSSRSPVDARFGGSTGLHRHRARLLGWPYSTSTPRQTARPQRRKQKTKPMFNSTILPFLSTASLFVLLLGLLKAFEYTVCYESSASSFPASAVLSIMPSTVASRICKPADTCHTTENPFDHLFCKLFHPFLFPQYPDFDNARDDPNEEDLLHQPPPVYESATALLDQSHSKVLSLIFGLNHLPDTKTVAEAAAKAKSIGKGVEKLSNFTRKEDIAEGFTSLSASLHEITDTLATLKAKLYHTNRRIVRKFERLAKVLHQFSTQCLAESSGGGGTAINRDPILDGRRKLSAMNPSGKAATTALSYRSCASRSPQAQSYTHTIQVLFSQTMDDIHSSLTSLTMLTKTTLDRITDASVLFDTIHNDMLNEQQDLTLTIEQLEEDRAVAQSASERASRERNDPWWMSWGWKQKPYPRPEDGEEDLTVALIQISMERMRKEQEYLERVMGSLIGSRMQGVVVGLDTSVKEFRTHIVDFKAEMMVPWTTGSSRSSLLSSATSATPNAIDASERNVHGLLLESASRPLPGSPSASASSSKTETKSDPKSNQERQKVNTAEEEQAGGGWALGRYPDWYDQLDVVEVQVGELRNALDGVRYYSSRR